MTETLPFARGEVLCQPATPCGCKVPGVYNECHCRSKTLGLRFASDDWCICLCHRIPDNWRELAEQRRAQGDRPDAGSPPTPPDGET